MSIKRQPRPGVVLGAVPNTLAPGPGFPKRQTEEVSRSPAEMRHQKQKNPEKNIRNSLTFDFF